jgi:metallo-beta-lactamase class B
VEPLHIVGPIWYVGTKDLGVYLITTPAGHILIDGAMPGTGPMIEASIRKAGFKPEDIRQLLITHAHVDHVGTLAWFKKLTGAPLAVMAPDDALLKSGGKADYLYRKDRQFRFPPVTADRVLKDGDTVTLGDVTLTGRLTPGHTRGCTTWIMPADDGGHSYNVVFAGSTSINTGTRLVQDPSYPGIADDYRRALDVQASLEPDIFLAAHASAFDLAGKRERAAAEGAAAFVDPGRYRSRITDQRENLEAQIAKEVGASNGLGGTRWRLVRFQGGDDTTLTPDDPANYTVEFLVDGTLNARLDCNRGHGGWKSSGPGRLELGPMALTRAICPPGSMHDQLVKHWGFIRSYVLKGGHLFLSLQADGGIYEFEPN